MKRLFLTSLLIIFLSLACGNGYSPPPPGDPGGVSLAPGGGGQPVTWQPPQTPGLHLILDRASKREYFSVLRVPGGLLLGEYGLYEGGPEIQFYDGALKTEIHIPDVESVFSIFDPGDGLPLATTEHHGRIYKRTAAGKWELKYSRLEQIALMFYVRKAGALYGLYNLYGSHLSGLVCSLDKGNTWTEMFQYVGMDFFGIASDGDFIYLAGSVNNYPILATIEGKEITSYPSAKGYSWWGIAKAGGVWNMGTWTKYEDGVDQPGYIDAFDGIKPAKVYTTDRPHIHAMDIHQGKRYAVATWDWNASSDKTSLLLTSPDGYSWSVLVTIPCPHIMGMGFGDGGVYLAGGKFRENGRVYFFR